MMAINLFKYIGLYTAIEDTIKNRLPHEINGTDEHVSQYMHKRHVAGVSSGTRDQTFGLSLHFICNLCVRAEHMRIQRGHGVWTLLENRKI